METRQCIALANEQDRLTVAEFEALITRSGTTGLDSTGPDNAGKRQRRRPKPARPKPGSPQRQAIASIDPDSIDPDSGGSNVLESRVREPNSNMQDVP